MVQVADGHGAATATCVLATDGLGSATVVQGGWVTSLLIADLGARKNGGSGAAVGQRGNAFLTTDGLGSATVVRMCTSLLIADLGARKNGVIGATVGQRGNAWGGSDI